MTRNQNLTGGNTSITTPQLSISETTNRITTAGYVYDASGNLTNDTLHAYTYDAENRIKTVDTTAATYTYFGPLRVKKVQGATTTVYIFSGSKVIAEYANGSLSKEYVYSGATLLATHEGSTLKYHHPDHLSTRVETDGATAATVRTFGQFPFGEAWYETGTASKLKFTSYERDSESGLDQAMFRYDSSRLGRFMSPDLLAGSKSVPQSMNRYAYASNDPVARTDPSGLRPSAGEQDILLPVISWCRLDGFSTPCSLVYKLVAGGAAFACPNNICEFTKNWNGEFLSFVRFQCLADGYCGYHAVYGPGSLYFSFNAAAIAAGRWGKDMEKDNPQFFQEYIGNLYQDPNGYFTFDLTGVGPCNASGTCQGTVNPYATPKDYFLVAFWHTHHDRAISSLPFSSTSDRQTADFWTVPFITSAFGNVMIYVPGNNCFNGDAVLYGGNVPGACNYTYEIH